MTTFLKNRDMKFSFHLLLACIALTACGESGKTTADYRIVPCPGEIAPGDGGDFELDARTRIVCTGDNDGMRANAEFLAGYVESVVGSAPEITGPDGLCDDGRAVILRADAPGKGGEAYEIEVSENRITVSGESDAGVFYGIQTLRKAMGAAKAAKVLFPAVRIADEPYLGYRGVMLDVGRTFYPVEEVKRIIDLAALHNLNVFHWHLTDDQGWRIEIDAYPRLTETGAFRRDTTLAGEPGTFGGYYTKRQIRDIVEYAARRYIEVVPEIDMPGHCLSAIANYEGLSCFDQVGWGKVFTSPLCPGKDAALEFCRNVWSEVIALFPYEYVHIGGDEVEKDNWRKCADCQRRIAQQGLKGVEELQSWFIHEMERFFNAKGRRMIGWDEIIEGGLSKTSTVMWWRNWAPQSVPEATAHGNDVIYTPATPFYFSQNEEKSSMRQVYDYDLAPASLSAAQRAHIIGVQANLWAEGIPSRSRMLYMYFPRILALAELAWTQPAQKDYDDFYGRLRQQLSMLNRLGVPYRIPSLDGFHNVNAFTDKGTLSVECQDPQAVIRYTTDGTFPNAESPRYVGPITVDQTTPFTLRTFTPEGRADEMVQADFVKQGLLPALQSVPALNPGVKTDWYDFPGVTCRLITTAPFNGSYTTPDVVIPEACKGNIGLITKGYILIPEDGVYTFALLSDDGSWLKIDGNMVVDNDREQSPHEMVRQQALAKGYHYLEVRYFDHNGGVLRLNVLDPQGKRLDPQTIFFHAAEN